MSHRQILPPPPTVEDAMDDVALTPYNPPDSAFNFEGWQEAPQRGPLSLLPRSPPLVTAAPSNDSSPEAVIHSVPLQFQPQRRKGKAPIRSQGPTPSNAEFQGLRAQLQQLQQERKQLWHKCRNSRICRQPTQGHCNAPLPMCKTQPIPPQYIKHSYPVVSAVNWITSLTS